MSDLVKEARHESSLLKRNTPAGTTTEQLLDRLADRIEALEKIEKAVRDGLVARTKGLLDEEKFWLTLSMLIFGDTLPHICDTPAWISADNEYVTGAEICRACYDKGGPVPIRAALGESHEAE